ncbi:MAG: HAD family hydrolase [Candidatus Bathyarchaeia archaeon]|jgi:HAD superfamily hydrolase (TIGR01509 family)
MREDKFKAKCIFLDLDGTIVDSRQAYLEAAQIGFKAIGQEPPEMKIVLEIPKRIEQGLGFDDLIYGDLNKFKTAYIQAYHVLTEEKTRLLPNVSSAIEALALKAKLGLITMRHVPNQAVLKELNCFGIGKYFSSVMTALDTTKPKPSPEAIFKCVQTLDMEICDCLMAGDSVNDIKAGKAAGAKTVGLLSGLYFHEELAKEGPDMILPDLSMLPDVVN